MMTKDLVYFNYIRRVAQHPQIIDRDPQKRGEQC